ncbi:MAG: FAD-dependent oxidoreductase [Chitinophagaceae bacterium]
MQTQMQNNALATEIISNNQQLEVRYYNTVSKQVHSIQTNQIILATPQFVNKKLLPNETYRNAIINEKLHYVPWMVANLHTENLVERNGAPLSWDNVLYNSESLGYIKANHQLLTQSKGSNNLTYYLPLTNHAPTTERQHAYDKKQEDWADLVMNDLKVVHPNIADATKQIDVMVWGHAMAQPLPNLIHSDIRKKLQQSINNKIHFAHTDLAGISIFEEAFYQGIHAAKKVIEQLNNESNK